MNEIKSLTKLVCFIKQKKQEKINSLLPIIDFLRSKNNCICFENYIINRYEAGYEKDFDAAIHVIKKLIDDDNFSKCEGTCLIFEFNINKDKE